MPIDMDMTRGPHGLEPDTTVRRLDRQDLAGLVHVLPPSWLWDPLEA